MTAIDDQDHASHLRPGTIVAGALLLMLGAAMLLDPNGTLRLDANRVAVPLLLVAFGVAALLNGSVHRDGQPARVGRRGRRFRSGAGGVWLIGIGVWMLVSEMHLFGLDYGNAWPIFIVLSGIVMVMRGVR